MEKVVVSAKTRKQKSVKLTKKEQRERKAEDAAWKPPTPSATFEEILEEAGVVTKADLEAARRRLEKRL